MLKTDLYNQESELLIDTSKGKQALLLFVDHQIYLVVHSVFFKNPEPECLVC